MKLCAKPFRSLVLNARSSKSWRNWKAILSTTMSFTCNLNGEINSYDIKIPGATATSPQRPFSSVPKVTVTAFLYQIFCTCTCFEKEADSTTTWKWLAQWGLATASDLAAFRLSMIAAVKKSVNHSRTVASMRERGWEQHQQVRLRSDSTVWSEFAFGPVGHCCLWCNRFFPQ